LTVAIRAKNRLIATRFKRDFRLFATLGAYYGEHLAVDAAAAAAIITLFPGTAAVRTALRLIGKTLGLVEFLFLSGECEGGSAIGALDRLVLKDHWMTSSNKF
jgi:hypothetical protein